MAYPCNSRWSTHANLDVYLRKLDCLPVKTWMIHPANPEVHPCKLRWSTHANHANQKVYSCKLHGLPMQTWVAYPCKPGWTTHANPDGLPMKTWMDYSCKPDGLPMQTRWSTCTNLFSFTNSSFPNLDFSFELWIMEVRAKGRLSFLLPSVWIPLCHPNR